MTERRSHSGSAKGRVGPPFLLGALASVLALGALGGCAGGASGDIEGATSGPPYEVPTTVLTASLDGVADRRSGAALIDTAHCDEGYAVVSAVGRDRLKLQVICGQMSYNYDLPQDGAPIVVPMNMGDGSYEIIVLENASGTIYAEVTSRSAEVRLESEFAPYLRPNVFCRYTADSQCVAKARELAEHATNQGDVVRAIYRWMMDAISYDDEKARRLSGTSGYVPDPDATLQSGYGICFDYASLAAAMFRSLGIPCQIVTGNVAPEDVYHAWNLIYIDGEWVSALITVGPDEWTRIDLTFAASEGDDYLRRDEACYRERYRY